MKYFRFQISVMEDGSNFKIHKGVPLKKVKEHLKYVRDLKIKIAPKIPFKRNVVTVVYYNKKLNIETYWGYVYTNTGKKAQDLVIGFIKDIAQINNIFEDSVLVDSNKPGYLTIIKDEIEKNSLEKTPKK